MASIGPIYPGTLASDSTGSGGFTAWTSPSNAGASDNTRANAFMSGATKPSHYLKATNFDFSAIPAGATIDGIEVLIEKADIGGLANNQDSQVKIIKGGTVGSTNKADTSTNWSGTDTTITYGSSTDLWGETWTDTDIKASTFGTAFMATTNSGGKVGSNAAVDGIQIKVYYTEAVAATNLVDAMFFD